MNLKNLKQVIVLLLGSLVLFGGIRAEDITIDGKQYSLGDVFQLSIMDSDPGTPNYGSLNIYSKLNGSTEKLYIQDSDGNVTELGTGGGLTIKESDDSPSGTCTTLKVTNGTLTDDGGGTFSLVTGAGAGGGAPTDAHYVTSQAEGGLSAEVNLGALATGLLKGTVSGGVSTISAVTDASANWNTAYGWGNHASAGYLTAEVDGSVSNELPTAGNYIDVTGTEVAFDPTEITGGTTWDDGGEASVVWTWSLSGATDPQITFANDLMTLANGLTLTTGNNFIIGTVQWNSGDSIDGTKVANADLGDIGVSSGVWSVEDESHAHTTTTISGIDISDDTNLAGTANEITLTGDTLSLHSAITRDSEWTGIDFLVGTATGTLSGEIAVGTTPGGELGGTWASPTLDDSVAVSSWSLTTPTVIGNAIFNNGATSAGSLSIYEDTDDGTNYTKFQTTAQAGDITYTLPPDDGDAGEQLQTNGSGVLTWEAAGAGGATTWTDIGDATADTTIALGAYETLLTSTLDEAAHSVLTIYSSSALSQNTTLLKLKYQDDGDSDGNFLECLDNSGADSKFKVGANGAVTAGVITSTANIKGVPHQLRVTIVDPKSVYGKDHEICIWPKVDAALTVTNIEVTCDANPTTEPTGDIKYADTFIGLASATVINDFDTTDGVRSDSSITSGAVAAGKAMYISFDAEPEAAMTQISFVITYDYD